MFLPHFSEESGSSYILRNQHHKRDEAGYLFTSAHIRVVFVFSMARKLLALVEGRSNTAQCAMRKCFVNRAGQHSGGKD
jgi:hypothetical protein